MDESQALPLRIAALRQRLREANGSTCTGNATAADRDVQESPSRDGETFRARTPAHEHSRGLGAFSEAGQGASASAIVGTGRDSVSSRVQTSLARGRELLAKLRKFSEDPLLKLSDDDPLNRSFDECTAMVHLALRTVQAFGDADGCQLALCEGLDAILNAVDERSLLIGSLLERRRAWKQRAAVAQSSGVMLVRRASAALAQRSRSLLVWAARTRSSSLLRALARSLNVVSHEGAKGDWLSMPPASGSQLIR